MRERTHTYYYARLSLLASADRGSVVWKALTSNQTEPDGKFRYGFFDIRELESPSGPFVFGFLVKYKPQLEGEVVDENSHELVDGALQRGVVAKSEFFLHMSTSVVAYHPIINKLSDRQFRRVFAVLIERAHDDFFVDAQLQNINEVLKIEEAFRALDSIRFVSFELHPSNPSNADEWRALDERMRQLEADQLKQTIEARDAGLNREALRDDEGYRGILMAADGYGKGVIEGTRDGRSVRITTADSPVRSKVAASEDPYSVLDQLRATFERIWARVRNED